MLGAYPLGVRKGTSGEVVLRGYNLESKVRVAGKPEADSEDTVMLRPEHAFNEVRVALGDEPEMFCRAAQFPCP